MAHTFPKVDMTEDEDAEKKVKRALKAKAVEVKPSKDALKKIQAKIEKKREK